MPKGVRCETCGRFAEEIDYRLVPQVELVTWAKFGEVQKLNQGWYWCAECNWFEHGPSIEMAENHVKEYLART